MLARPEDSRNPAKECATAGMPEARGARADHKSVIKMTTGDGAADASLASAEAGGFTPDGLTRWSVRPGHETIVAPGSDEG
jgi:hypothetical protein